MINSMLQETWLAELTQESGNEIYVLSADTLSFLHVNLAASHNLQYSADELQRMTAPDVMRDISKERLDCLISQLRCGSAEHFSIETAHRRKDGSFYPSTLRLFYLHLQVPALVAVSSDQHASATHSLIATNENQLSQIQAHLPGLLFQMRQTSQSCLYFPFLSKGSYDLLGLTPKELYANPGSFTDMIIEEDQENWIDSLNNSARLMTTLNWEGRIWINAWQDVKWINLRATPQDRGTQGLEWTGLMTNITQSKKQEEDIRCSRAQLAELNAHVENIKELERNRIKQDLHDDLGGNLTALKMMLSQLQKRLPADNKDFSDRVRHLDSLIDHSINSMHRIAVGLRPGILEAGLVTALEWLAQEGQQQMGIPFQFSCNAEDIALDPKVAVGIFLIAQEACNNIRKHADASGVELRLYEGCDELQLEIIDNGCGMTPPDQRSAKSFGLRSMKERATGMGGNFSIASRQGKGTIITVDIPLPFASAIY
jgi:signal transduction histidine kinase